jgi:phenylacetate-CoA ligase
VPLAQKKPPFWRYNLIGRQILFSTYHMNPVNLRDYVEKIKKSKIKIVDGYPSTIYILAKYLESKNTCLPMKAVFTGAEPIFDYQRKVIGERLCCEIYDHYGLTEKVVSAGECEAHDGRHITMEGTFVEVIPARQRSSANGYGEVIGTSLVNYAMPLIRYRTGDMSAFIETDCTCGRKLPRIKPVETKMEDIITTPDGRYVSASNLTFAFKPLSSINEAQIVQDNLHNIRVRIVRSENYNEQDTAELLNGLKTVLGDTVKIHIEFTDTIERTKTGKFRFVVSRIPFNL